MEPVESASVGKLVYICGKSYSTGMSECFSLKGKLIADLSLTCFVRTHSCPVVDMIDAYCAIASSSAFIFVLNEETLYDPECLNQLGVAILYNIPVIAVRIESFELPRPLPLRFYETRFVDKRINMRPPKKDSMQNDMPLTLAAVVIGCFESSIICKATSYVSFVKEVNRALSSITLDDAAEVAPSEEEGALKADAKVTAQIRHPRSGLGSSRTTRKILRNGGLSSSAHKQKGLQSIYGGEQRILSRQTLVNRLSYKKTDVSLSPVPSPLNRNGKRSPRVIGRQAFQREHTPNSAKEKENRIGYDENSPRIININSMEQKGNILVASPGIPRGKIDDISKSTSNSELNLSAQPAKSENELSVPVIGPKGQKLRRYSSLPVVPTQYLVASDKKSGSPQIMSFPPPNSSQCASPRSESPYLFNSDELEFDPIHISRTCTPVDAFESASRVDSPEESSR